MINLPLSSEVRAIVVGIDRYPDLGAKFDVPGATAGAWAFASWLVNECHVAAEHVQIWLAPLDGLAQSLVPNVDLRKLVWQDLQKVLDGPKEQFVGGGLLIMYFCGHGLVGGLRGDQHLVLPHASKEQLRCIDVANWRAHFHASGWERFEHQLWIIDACRNDWGLLVPSAQLWETYPPKALRRFVAFSCSIGEESEIDSNQGPRFTRDLLAELRMQNAAEWPDFGAAVRNVAGRWREDPLKGQSPIVAEDWDGSALQGNGLAEETLAQIFTRIRWDWERYRPYVEHAMRRAGAILSPNVRLNEALDRLQGLKKIDEVPPLLEFVDGVARAYPSEELTRWLNSRLTQQARAELQRRIDNDQANVRLSLWYRDDFRGEAPTLEAAFETIYAAGGVKPWRRVKGKPITGSLGEAVAQWVREAERHVRDQPVTLEIDLYLPRTFLRSGPCDSGRFGEDGDELRLGEDHGVLLHCTDRFKSTRWIGRLRQYQQTILDRLDRKDPALLRWVASQDDAEAIIRAEFIGKGTSQAAWLGFYLEEGQPSVLLDAAIAEGLPAVTWVRLPIDTAARKKILDELPEQLAAPVDGLCTRLKDWRLAQHREVHQHVSVLLDQIERRPMLFKKFSQP